MRIIDLSVPVGEGHVRWSVERSVKGNLEAGDLFQATTIRLPCHGFTHVDAKRHFFKGEPTIEATDLDDLVGPAKVIDLKDVQPNQAIDAALLQDRLDAARAEAGDRLLLVTAWHRHRDINTEAFWREAPYITRDGAEYLESRAPRTVCFDFPQDYCIRLMLDGEQRPIEENVTHDTLLRAGVHMVEYLTNTAEISARDVFLSAAPIKITNADGAPARVYVIEGMA
ncbi:MAG: cyclase family protein [Pseudomonadota bacterium]